MITQPHAIGYVRVSKQTEAGLSLDAQRTAIHAAALRLGLSLGQVFEDDGVSGGLAIEDRPVLLDAVASLKRGDVLLVAKRDRIGRDVIAVAMIERLVTKRGARIVSAAGEGSDASAADDPASQLMRRLIDSFAEYERLIIGARTKSALAAKRRRGERISRFAPYGWCLTADGRLEPCAGEQSTLQTMREHRATGESYEAIAETLTQRGILTRSGSPFRRQFVYRVLRRAA